MLVQLRHWSARRWAAAVVAAAITALLVGIPTDVIPTPLYQRMTPVLWWDYPVWAATSLLAGLLTATYVHAPDSSAVGRVAGGGLLGLLAVGCPVCNKVVVLLIGVSGALTWFAPLQPVLALISLALLGIGLRQRLRGQTSCPVPTQSSLPER